MAKVSTLNSKGGQHLENTKQAISDAKSHRKFLPFTILPEAMTAVKLFSPNCLSHCHKAVFEIIHNAQILWVNGWREAFAWVDENVLKKF